MFSPLPKDMDKSCNKPKKREIFVLSKWHDCEILIRFRGAMFCKL